MWSVEILSSKSINTRESVIFSMSDGFFEKFSKKGGKRMYVDCSFQGNSVEASTSSLCH